MPRSANAPRRSCAAIDPAVLDGPVPATPEWRGRDVLAHMVGVNDDVINGRLEGIASRFVDGGASGRAPLGDASPTCSTSGRSWSPEFEALLTAAPEEIAGQGLFDAMTHEHDLRNALGVPGARDSEAVNIAWSWIVGARTRGGLPAIRMITETDDVVAGAGEPTATVEASRFELLRAATGRRSASEVAALPLGSGCRSPSSCSAARSSRCAPNRSTNSAQPISASTRATLRPMTSRQ